MQVSGHAPVCRTGVPEPFRPAARTGIVAPSVHEGRPPRSPAGRGRRPVPARHPQGRRAARAPASSTALVRADSLYEFLWPRHDPDLARGALRRRSRPCAGAIGEEWVETHGDAIALRNGADFEPDVSDFRTLAAEVLLREPERAVKLFYSDFLEGFRDARTARSSALAEERG